VSLYEELGVIRVTRVVAAGRILNTKTARSQIMGSVVWGIGMALQSQHRPTTGDSVIPATAMTAF
jgi:xanthine dehydrogenase YagR molybdenum-binding subunit